MAKKMKSYTEYAPEIVRPAASATANVIPVVGSGSAVIEYDIHKIASMPEEDGSGQSAVIHLRVPTDCMRLIQIIKEADGSPFETNSDVARAAMFYFFNCHPHGLRLTHTKEYRALMRLSAVNKRHMVIERMEELISHTYLHIGKCIDKKRPAEAKRSVQELLDAINDMEAGEWRDGFFEHVKSTWGHLIQSCVLKSAVGPSGDDEELVDEYEGDGD